MKKVFSFEVLFFLNLIETLKHKSQHFLNLSFQKMSYRLR